MLNGVTEKVDVDGVMMAKDREGQLQPITKEFVEARFQAKIDLACDFKPIKISEHDDQSLSIDSQEFRSHAQHVL
jgi:hypothetical protein